MKQYRIVPIAVLLANLLPARICPAWGIDGHRIIADIAEHLLTPQARNTVNAMLIDQSMADVSTWADEIKSDPAYHWAYPLHYTNVPPDADTYVLRRDCPKHGCVVSAILKYTEVLRSSTNPAQRAEALRFLIHFVGDVHQPMHVGHASDRGGNDIQVVFFGQANDLHAVWDTDLLARAADDWVDYAAGLRKNITAAQCLLWTDALDPVRWATESGRLAKKVAYAIPSNGQLGQEYYNRAMPVVNARLSMAGVRLAALLNNIFATQTQPAPTTAPASQPATAIPR